MGSSKEIVNLIKNQTNTPLGVTSSPSNTLEITIDIREDNKLQRTLGQMVFVMIEEDGQKVLVMGQVVAVETKNRWHEDQAFKGVIKRYGKLPHLSGVADNRVARISVQACYSLANDDPSAYVLGTSPSTGEGVEVMTNEVMDLLMDKHKQDITYLGRFYNTDVRAPFWFKHFGETANDETGAGDAYHIGVFGKTGSGKSNTAANMLLGYAKNKHNMSVLVLDPQGQFYADHKLLPGNRKLENEVKALGVNYEKYHILKDVCLPPTLYDLFGDLLVGNQFVQRALGPFYDDDKLQRAKDAIVEYVSGRANVPEFSLSKISDPKGFLKDMLARFLTPKEQGEGSQGFSKYIVRVYGTRETRQSFKERVQTLHDNLDSNDAVVERWIKTLNLFQEEVNGTKKMPVKELVTKAVDQSGNFVVLSLFDENPEVDAESLQAVFINIIEREIVRAGAKRYTNGSANCLIVMDEAHHFIALDSGEARIRELTKEIIRSVRTTRKYGIGYMFITQTIESLDEEILKQMRIWAFGYGLTSGPEIRRIRDYINNDGAVQLYRSFIDPSSNRKFPFMFFGPISPLSFTGSPLFVEMFNDGDYPASQTQTTSEQPVESDTPS